MMNRYCIYSVVLIFMSCNNNDSIHNPDTYESMESHIYSDCAIYKMVFYEGDHIFNFALAGACKDLTQGDYLDDYKKFLNENYRNICNRRGLVTFEYYFLFEKGNNDFINSIIQITKKNFNSNVSLVDVKNQKCSLKIGGGSSVHSSRSAAPSDNK
jgi:hypothetical protein